MKQQKIIAFISLFLVVMLNLARGQSTIKAVVDKNKILLGEGLQLSIEVSIERRSNLIFIAPDTIPHFEFVEPPRFDSSSSSNGTLIKTSYRLTSFDSGRWSIPSFSLSPRVKTDSIPIDVVFSDFDPQKEYHDIKDIIEVSPPKNKMKWWWFVAAGLLLALVVYSVLRKKPKPPFVATKFSLNAYDEAIKELNELKRENLPSKQFHTGIISVFRTYVFKKKGILSLQKTTADLVVQLKELNLDKPEFEKLAQALRLSDFVKFAKYEPATEDNEGVWQTIRDSIDKIETGV